MIDEKPRLKDKLKNTFDKLKRIKNIEVIICIILIAVVLLIYGVVKTADGKKDADVGENVQTVEVSEADLLANVLSDIKGAGKVSVYISYDGKGETVYAYDSNSVTTVREDDSGGATLKTTVIEENSVPVFVTVNGEKTPLIAKTLEPEILGVVIVAEGARDISVRLQLMRAAATALKINENIIEIFIMN